MLRSAGVIKVDRLEELLDVSAILLASPLPGGRRVALVGNSGGPLILTADACEGGELTVPELGQATRNALGEVLAAAAATANPVDLTADGTAAMLERALDIVLADNAVDAVITVVVETMAIPAAAARHVLNRVARRAASRSWPAPSRRPPGPGQAAPPGSPRSRHRSERRWLLAASAATRSGAGAQCCPRGSPKSRPTIR